MPVAVVAIVIAAHGGGVGRLLDAAGKHVLTLGAWAAAVDGLARVAGEVLLCRNVFFEYGGNSWFAMNQPCIEVAACDKRMNAGVAAPSAASGASL